MFWLVRLEVDCLRCQKVSDKAGIKSETIARWFVTYYDVTATESSEGHLGQSAWIFKQVQETEVVMMMAFDLLKPTLMARMNLG